MECFQEVLLNTDKLLDDIQDYYEDSGDMHFNKIEEIFILNALEMNKGNRTLTAKFLNISVRTLRNKLNEYRSTGTIH